MATFTKYAKKLEVIQRKNKLKFNKGLTKNLKKRRTVQRNIYSV